MGFEVPRLQPGQTLKLSRCPAPSHLGVARVSGAGGQQPGTKTKDLLLIIWHSPPPPAPMPGALEVTAVLQPGVGKGVRGPGSPSWAWQAGAGGQDGPALPSLLSLCICPLKTG